MNNLINAHDQFMIRAHSEPEYGDSEGFRYVKSCGERSLTWTYSVQRAKRMTHTDACEVHRLLREVQTESEIVSAPPEDNSSTPDLDNRVTAVKVKTVTDDDWIIEQGECGKFCISRTLDGGFLKRVCVVTDAVAYEWVESEKNAKQFDSLEAANDFASEVLLLQTYRAPEVQLPVKVGPKVGRNDPCPCGSGKKWKKCCMEAK